MFNGAGRRDEDIINGAVLNLEHCFGISNEPIYKNVHFISEDTILFSAGRHLATCDLVSRRMDFIRRDDPSVGSTQSLAIGLSKKKELVVGVGEKYLHNGWPRVSVYIPSRMRWFFLNFDAQIMANIGQDSTIEQIAIPNFKKYVVTVTRARQTSTLTVTYFRYEKEKPSRFADMKPQVKKIAVDPMNHYHFIACGNKYMKMIDAYDSFKEVKELVIPIKYERENDFVDVCFI